MSIMRIRSIIKEYFSDEMINNLQRVYKARNKIKVSKEVLDDAPGMVRNKLRIESEEEDNYIVRISSNNDKINISKAYLMKEFGVNCGYATGTNRFALLIDGYAIKIAQDAEGVQDNFHEFYMSKIAYPYVTKVYETNGLISVHEYIRVLSFQNEFEAARTKVMNTLENLSEITSLMLDVGCIQKNRSNWGIRPSTGEAVSLDFAYMYTELESIDLTCDSKNCNKRHGIIPLEYTSDYSTLMCPKCKKEYSDQELHALIDEDARRNMYQQMKDNRQYPIFKVTKPVSYFEVDAFGEIEEIHGFGKVETDNTDRSKRLKKEDAQKLLNRLVEMNDDFEMRRMTSTSIEEFELVEYEEIRKTLCEYRFDKRWKEMTEEERNFNPLKNYKPENEKSKYKESKDVQFVTDVINSVNYEFQDSVRQTRNDLIKGILAGIYDTDDIFTPTSTIKRLLEIKNNKIDKPYIDEYNRSVLDDLEGNILEVEVKQNEVIEHSDEEMRQMMLAEFCKNDEELNYIDYEDEEEEELVDPKEYKRYDVYGSNCEWIGGKYTITYSYLENWSEYNLQEVKDMGLPLWDEQEQTNILDVRLVGDVIYIDHEHPGVVYKGDGLYVPGKKVEDKQEDLSFVDLKRGMTDNDISSDEELRGYSYQNAENYKLR